MRPQVLVLDEPTAGLDPRGRDFLLGDIKRLNEGGTTIVQVTHSETNASFGDRIIRLKDGWVVDED